MQGSSSGADSGSGGDILALPELCLSHIISLTSPPEACLSAAVCTAFRSAVSSDTVWELFLPPDYQSILDRAPEPIKHFSKRDLFRHLCLRYVLIDGGLMSFSLCKTTGAKCYMLSAKKLNIPFVDDPQRWIWMPCEHSRFSDVCKRLYGRLLLGISGKIESNLLSLKTKYTVYLLFKYHYCNRHTIESSPQEVTIRVGSSISKHMACLGYDDTNRYPRRIRVPVDIGRGKIDMNTFWWMELELGEFYNDDGDGEVEVSLEQSQSPKPGLIIEGMEFRPTKSKP